MRDCTRASNYFLQKAYWGRADRLGEIWKSHSSSTSVYSSFPGVRALPLPLVLVARGVTLGEALSSSSSSLAETDASLSERPNRLGGGVGRGVRGCFGAWRARRRGEVVDARWWRRIGPDSDSEAEDELERPYFIASASRAGRCLDRLWPRPK